jgi:hypothetical protein
MRWVHGTWQCPRCRFKLGCCEGEAQHACAPRVERRLGNRLRAEVRLPTHHDELSAGEAEAEPNQAPTDGDANGFARRLEVPAHQLCSSLKDGLLGR